MKYTTNYNLKKPEGSDLIDIEDLNENFGILDTELSKKVDKIIGKQLSTEDYTTEEKNKLKEIEIGANNYIHPGSGTNPHGTTKTDVGLGSVLNYGIATQAEAQAGTSNTNYMTPLRTKEAIEKLASGKKYATIVIGNTGAGHTLSDCDYLCTGTNDQTVINQAISSISGSSGGKIVLLEGKYFLTSSLLVRNRNNLIISGTGRSTSLIRNFNDSGTISGTSYGVINLMNARYIVIEDLMIDSDNVTWSGKGLAFQSSNDITVNNVTVNIISTNGDSVYMTECEYVKIYNSTLKSPFAWAVYLRMSNYITVFNCYLEGYTAIELHSCNDIKVLDSYIYGTGDNTMNITNLSSSISVIGNHVVGDGSGEYRGLNLYGPSSGRGIRNVLIKDNFFYNSDIDLFLDYCENVIISSNTFSLSTYSGIWVSTNCMDISICENNIFSASHGIIMSGRRSVISNNIVRDCFVGIMFRSGSELNNVIGNSVFRGTGTSGEYTDSQHTIQLLVGSQKNLIIGNTCFGKNVANSGSLNIVLNNEY